MSLCKLWFCIKNTLCSPFCLWIICHCLSAFPAAFLIHSLINNSWTSGKRDLSLGKYELFYFHCLLIGLHITGSVLIFPWQRKSHFIWYFKSLTFIGTVKKKFFTLMCSNDRYIRLKLATKLKSN